MERRCARLCCRVVIDKCQHSMTQMRRLTALNIHQVANSSVWQFCCSSMTRTEVFVETLISQSRRCTRHRVGLCYASSEPDQSVAGKGSNNSRYSHRRQWRYDPERDGCSQGS